MTVSVLLIVIMILSLIVAGVIVARRFPQLSLLDVEHIPEVQEEKKKMHYLRERMKQRSAEGQMRREKILQPMVKWFQRLQSGFRNYVAQIERLVRHGDLQSEIVPPVVHAQEGSDGLKSLLDAAAGAYERNDFDGAEKKYIAAIKLNPKCAPAYRGLGDVYRKQGHASEARETYAFVAQLDPSDDVVLVKLAELAEEENKKEEAVEYYQQAVLLNDNLSIRFAKIAELLLALGQYAAALEAIEQALDLEPQNPKYLDVLAEISILMGRKDKALAAYDALRMANPDNQKLALLKDKIDSMKTV